MKKRINWADQYSRRECLEIAGIPNENKDRCLEKFILEGTSKKPDFDINAHDVSACPQLKTPRE